MKMKKGYKTGHLKKKGKKMKKGYKTGHKKK